MSDLIEVLIDIVLELGIISIDSRRESFVVRIIIYLILFSIVAALVLLAYLNRTHKPLFYTFSISGSLLGIWLLVLLRDLKNESKRSLE